MKICNNCATLIKNTEDNFCPKCEFKVNVFDTKEHKAVDILKFADNCEYTITNIELIKMILETNDSNESKLKAIDRVAFDKRVNFTEFL